MATASSTLETAFRESNQSAVVAWVDKVGGGE